MIAKYRPACLFHKAVFVVSGIYVLPWANKGLTLRIFTSSDGMAGHLSFSLLVFLGFYQKGPGPNNAELDWLGTDLC